MSTEMIAEHGRRAGEILACEVFRAALADAEQRLVKEWLAADSTAAREASWAKVHALGAVTDALRRTVSEGEIAKHTLASSR
jgi:hypothetical protein